VEPIWIVVDKTGVPRAFQDSEGGAHRIVLEYDFNRNPWAPHRAVQMVDAAELDAANDAKNRYYYLAVKLVKEIDQDDGKAQVGESTEESVLRAIEEVKALRAALAEAEAAL
jgi:hypothetical protein